MDKSSTEPPPGHLKPVSDASHAPGAFRAIPSVNRIFGLTFALVVGLTILVVITMVFVAAQALYRWELETINAVLAGTKGPATLAIEYLDRTQAQNVTDGLMKSPGFFAATLSDDFGGTLATSSRPKQDTAWIIDLLQLIWGQSTIEVHQNIAVSSGREGRLSVGVILGETRGQLIQASLLAILLQAALIIALVSALIYWTTSLPLVSGLRTLSNWIRQAGKDELIPLPAPASFRFSEIYDSGNFIHSTVQDLHRERRDLAATVKQLEDQIRLNEQYLNIIQQILSLSRKTALHISATGQLTWYNQNEAGLGFLKDAAAASVNESAQEFLTRLKALPDVRKVTLKPLPNNDRDTGGRTLFDIDLDLNDRRILQLVGIDTGDGGRALMVSDETQVRAFTQDIFQKQKLESLGILTSGVAHDMNNILAILSASIELEIARNTKPATRQNLNIARAAVSQGTSVVRTLLTFSRKSKAEVSVENAASILQDLHVILKGKVGPEIQVTYEIGLDDALISVDRPRLTNALMNLAINASDSINGKGNIAFILREATPEDDVPAGASNSDDFVVFEVEDNGSGIPDDIRLRIMDPFFTTKSADKGTGLGLTLVYNVAEEFGGKLSFRSELGHGSTFMIALPRIGSEPASQSRVPEVSGSRIAHASQKLLLIDDEPGLLKIPRLLLEERGYAVTTASSVAEANAILDNETTFDVIVTDLRLGDGTAADIARRVRATDQECTIILVSGNMDYQVRNDALFDGSLEKPFAWSDLDTLIQQLTGRKRSMISH